MQIQMPAAKTRNITSTTAHTTTATTAGVGGFQSDLDQRILRHRVCSECSLLLTRQTTYNAYWLPSRSFFFILKPTQCGSSLGEQFIQTFKDTDKHNIKACFIEIVNVNRNLAAK